MRVKSLPVLFLAIAFSCLAVTSEAQDPVKWSAPMNEYPNPWYPTPAPPPSQYYPWGYYGGYGGYYPGYYPGYYQGGYQGYGGQQGYSGNPYYYYQQ